ncbi:MAG: hypothetical protein ABI686_01385 [Acidobacteriota bacterium]
MTYILTKDLPDVESHIHEKRRSENWQAYQNRLQKIKKRMPLSVQEYALADWHYNFSDHRCPHDAWLEHLIVRELVSGERSEIRSLEIEVKLLGAYHDGYIEFHYKEVKSYCFDQPHRQGKWETTKKRHKDWIVDEVDLSGNGYILHEIEWLDGGHWFIECRSFEYNWIPIDKFLSS